MRRHRTYYSSLAVLSAAVLALTGCPAAEEPEPDPMTDEPAPEVDERVQVFEAELQEVEGSAVTGTATIVIDGERVEARVMARGFDPDQRVPQHVHVNPTCDEPGGILINLDTDLSHANETAPSGDHYPAADGDGTLDYHASRSLDDLRDAAREHQGVTLEQLDLGNRVVNLHGEDMQPISCGPLEERRDVDVGRTQPMR